MESGARSLRRSLRTPVGVHYAALVVTAVLLLAAVSRAWFFFDDWAFLVPSQSDIWAPHVGHWSTTPFLLFLGSRNVFGLNSYLPFVIPVIVAQLALAHLIWRFSLRVGLTPWIATVLSLLLMFFGAGSENVLWAFQVGFVGAMTLAMVVVMVFLGERLRWRDGILIAVLGTIALSCSGTAIPVLVVAALIGWSRHGIARTAGSLAIPALSYLIWFAVIGRTAAPDGRAEGLTQTFYGVPTFAISMLTDGLGRALPVAILGTLIFSAVAIWGVLTARRAINRARPAYLLFLAAPLFALVTGFSRVGLGLETATSSRYLFFIIPMMLPLIGLALDAAIRRANLPLGAVVVLLLVIVVYNAGGLVGALATRDARSQNTRERLSATVALESTYPHADPNSQPGGPWAPDVRLSDLEEFEKSHWFSPGHYSDEAELSVRAQLGITASTESAPVSQQGCLNHARGAVAVFADDRVLIDVQQPVSIEVSLKDGSVIGDARSIVVPAGWSRLALNGAVSPGVDLQVTSEASDVLACPSD